MAAYLEAYAGRWDLPVRLGIRVERLTRTAGDRFAVTTDAGPIHCDNVVVATGTFGRTPSIPDCAPDLDPSILQLHSSEYRRPGQLRDGPVLVVGASHSGTDIAYELAATRPTTLVGRDCGEIPIRLESRLIPLVFPLLMFAWRHVLTRRTPLGRKEMAAIRFHGGPMLRVKRADLAERGVVRNEARVEGVRDGLPLLGRRNDRGRDQRDLGDRLPPDLRLDRPAGPRRRRVATRAPRGGRRRPRAVLLRPVVPVRVLLDVAGRRRPGRGARRPSPSPNATPRRDHQAGLTRSPTRPLAGSIVRGEVSSVGMVDDLAQARTDYEQGDWSAALDIWSDIEPDDMSADDLHDAALAAYLLGRRDASVDFHQRAFALYQQAGSAAGAMRCCFHLAMIFGTGGEHALAQRLDHPRRAAPRRARPTTRSSTGTSRCCTCTATWIGQPPGRHRGRGGGRGRGQASTGIRICSPWG